jgi:hypothetical protein
VPCFQDEYHPNAEQDIIALRQAGRFHSLAQLIALLDGVIEYGMSAGETPVHPVHVVNGTGLYERCAPQMFGVFTIEQPPAPGQLPVFRLLAVGTTQAAARAAAAGRV